MDIEKNLFQFLKKNLSKSASLLLALSGGPDSLCLAQLLFEFQKDLNYTLEIAHVDHGIRLESKTEKELLEKWANEKKIPFHTTSLEKVEKRNLEAVLREKRYEFFKSIFNAKKYQALVLGHHQNDLEETVLKRLLEGASFDQLCPLTEISKIDEMLIWRPLINASKEEILNYAYEKKLTPFIDRTNFDLSNLRSKMRQVIIPQLEKQFGKKVRSNLKALSDASKDFSSYMNEKVNINLYLTSSDLGHCYDFSKNCPHPFELRYGLKKSLKELGISIQREELMKSVDWIFKKSTNKQLIKGKHVLYFDRGRLIVLSPDVQKEIKNKVLLSVGHHRVGKWQVFVEETFDQELEKTNWKDLFTQKGGVISQLPKGEYFLRNIDQKNDRFDFGKKLEKHVRSHYVPSCLTQLIPVIEFEGKIAAEFYTGEKKINNGKNGLNISILYKKD